MHSQLTIQSKASQGKGQELSIASDESNVVAGHQSSVPGKRDRCRREINTGNVNIR